MGSHVRIGLKVIEYIFKRSDSTSRLISVEDVENFIVISLIFEFLASF